MSNRQAIFWFVIIAAVALSGALQWVRDAMFHPWAHADPPLIDRWVGQLTAGNGDRLDLVLSLQRADTEECHNCNEIEGTAVTCDARGTVRRYRLAGSPKDRHGRQLHLGAVPEQQPPPDGLELDAVRGTWDGADTMDLAAGFFWRKGKSAISSTDDPATQPVPVRLQRRGASRNSTPNSRTAACAE